MYSTIYCRAVQQSAVTSLHASARPSRRLGNLIERVLSTDALALYDLAEERILECSPDIAASMKRHREGFHVCDDFLKGNWAQSLRTEAETMFEGGQFAPSYSMIADDEGVLQRVDKPGVFSRELDGNEQADANLLLHYTAAVVRTLPQCLNHYLKDECLSGLSLKAYGTKLAVTQAGAKYPRHVDNVGLPDRRKVTAIYYCNPNWQRGDGGELRLWGNGGLVEDVAPISDRLVVFWSDQVRISKTSIDLWSSYCCWSPPVKKWFVVLRTLRTLSPPLVIYSRWCTRCWPLKATIDML